MRITECYIESFGKLKNERISFSDGINSIKKDNGWGKTTLSTFIKVMLYGMSDTKKTSLEENDRKHYLPWDGSAARGTLTFRVGEREYRIERGFAPKPADDTFTLYDVATGKVTEDFGENLGEELFGIDADGFERTVFLSERALTPKSENKSVSAKLSDLVGCDGDIGVMDDAMKRLEEGRKFYYKKGGTGEIANIKNSIADTANRLEQLQISEEKLYKIENRLNDLRRILGELEKQKSLLLKEREAAAMASAKEGVVRHIRELRAEIAALSEKRGTYVSFFGDSMPTTGEINDAELKLREAARLDCEASKEKNSEYCELSLYFDNKTDDAEIAKIKSAIYEVKRKKALSESDEAKRLRELFRERIPTNSELDELIQLASQKSEAPLKKPNRVTALAGAVIIVAGLCLGTFINPALFVLSAVGLATFALAFVGKKNNRTQDKSEIFANFYSSVAGTVPPTDATLLSDLIEMRATVDRARSLESECQSGDAEGSILCFAEKFGFSTGDTVKFAEDVIFKFERFNSLRIAEGYRLGEEKKKRERIEKLRLEAKAFFDKYPAAKGFNLGDVREKLNEYERIHALIAAKEDEAAKFSKQYEESDSSESTRQSEEIDRDLSVTEEKIASIQHESAIAEKSRDQYGIELEEKEAVTMKLSELRELYEKHSENYEVIVKTKELLKKAKDSMTSKYLGKTKAGFEKYTEFISGTAGERFEMSTDFGVSKLEGASARSTDAYSRGTKDLYNLTSRLALIDSLYEGEEPFIILDDPFVSFDDKKAEAALKLLGELGKNRQIIYFTCSESRAI